MIIDLGYQDVGEISDLAPGNMLRVTAHGTWILIANVNGTCYAVADSCTHEEAPLSLGALVDDCVRCPLHGGRFCLRDGRALEEPAEIDLATYPVRIDGDRILIGRTGDPNMGNHSIKRIP